MAHDPNRRTLLRWPRRRGIADAAGVGAAAWRRTRACPDLSRPSYVWGGADRLRARVAREGFDMHVEGFDMLDAPVRSLACASRARRRCGRRATAACLGSGPYQPQTGITNTISVSLAERRSSVTSQQKICPCPLAPPKRRRAIRTVAAHRTEFFAGLSRSIHTRDPRAPRVSVTSQRTRRIDRRKGRP